jgi:hypothetical protein
MYKHRVRGKKERDSKFPFLKLGIEQSVSSVRNAELKSTHGGVLSYLFFMYLRAVLCTFQISVDFYYVPVGGRGGVRGGLEKGGGLERGG